MTFGLSAGGRLDGNTATAVEDLLAGNEKAGSRTTFAALAHGQVAPIQDCSACIKHGQCSIDDGFDTLMPSIYEADLLVLGTPLYWYGPSAQLKALLDRWSCLLDRDGLAFRQRMRGKRTVLLVAQGERGFYEAAPCLQMLEWSLRYLEMPLAGRVVVVGHARGDYGSDAPQRRQVRAAGADLAGGKFIDVMPPWFHLGYAPGAPLGGIYSA